MRMGQSCWLLAHSVRYAASRAGSLQSSMSNLKKKPAGKIEMWYSENSESHSCGKQMPGSGGQQCAQRILQLQLGEDLGTPSFVLSQGF